MAGRNNYVYRKGASPNTRLLNTQRVRVFSFDAESPDVFSQIGLVQTWNPTHSRAVEPWRGIGYGDQIAELGVGVTDLTATCSVMILYLRDIQQVFGYRAGSTGLIRSLKHHRWPFDVKESIVLPDVITEAGDDQGNGIVDFGGSRAIVTIYEGCWMQDYTKAFTIGESATTQDTTMMITDVYAEPLADLDTDMTDAAESNRLSSALYGL